MSSVHEIHQHAMKLAEEAEHARRAGDHATADRLLGEACEDGRRAALSFADNLSAEPTRSTLYLSAASLALECGEVREAERLAAAGMAGEAPEPIRRELHDLLTQAMADSDARRSSNRPGLTAPKDTAQDYYRARWDELYTAFETIRERCPTLMSDWEATSMPQWREFDSAGIAYGRLLRWGKAADCEEEVRARIEAARRLFRRSDYLALCAFIASLTPGEVEFVRRCIRAVASDFLNGEYLPTVIGLHGEEVAAVADAWPEVTEENSSKISAAVGGVLSNIVSYPHGRSEEEVRHYLGEDIRAVVTLHQQWRDANPVSEGFQAWED